MPERQVSSDRLIGRNVWLAVGPCGCGYAIDTCDDRDAQANVAGWRADGGKVVQVPMEEARERLVLDCPHEPRYGLLPLREARAEVIRLRVENERLRDLAGEAHAALVAIDHPLCPALLAAARAAASTTNNRTGETP